VRASAGRAVVERAELVVIAIGVVHARTTSGHSRIQSVAHELSLLHCESTVGLHSNFDLFAARRAVRPGQLRDNHDLRARRARVARGAWLSLGSARPLWSSRARCSRRPLRQRDLRPLRRAPAPRLRAGPKRVRRAVEGDRAADETRNWHPDTRDARDERIGRGHDRRLAGGLGVARGQTRRSAGLDLHRVDAVHRRRRAAGGRGRRASAAGDPDQPQGARGGDPASEPRRA
jgi:hypothetical protein